MLIMDYYGMQKALLEYLFEKHSQDKKFTFSVRQMASRGAESNYFIGTLKSNYFGFTCWDIPVYYPGSSSDLTNFIFTIKNNRCWLKFQYVMSKSEIGSQSEADLRFGYVL